MARENFVLMHGQVRGDPKITIDKEGHVVKGMFIMRVLRRPTTSGEFASRRLQIDCPLIYTRNQEMAMRMQDLKTGDMVDIRGVVTSRECRKSTRCPSCEHKNTSAGNIVYVTPIYMRVNEQADEDKGLALLKDRAEVSNIVNVIGNLCRDPDCYTDANGRHYAQYQLAVNRRIHIKEDADEIRTDYPWVKTFGNQAFDDSTYLHMGSCVYINGALQTRKIERKTVCEACGHEYEWRDDAAEIVPYYIGYLANCDTPEEVDDHGEEAQRAE